MEPFLNKVYKLEKSENFDVFLRASSLNGLTRMIVKRLKPKVVLIKNKDGSYNFNSDAGIIKTNYRFNLNEEFEEMGIMRDRAKSVVSFHGNTMVQVQRGIKEVKSVREFSHDQMIMTIYVDGQVCKRYFKPCYA